ncbi:hypothetical protein BGY98DRAFT_143051 [Russula aff. rugulosa BPL654]|nr:hypothetical protein BGY98DRAFT_143051 [Russula aff. rugulosa BPL654]
MTQLVWIHEDPAIQQPVRGKRRRRVTIKMVPEDILLEIFDFYRHWAIKQNQERPWEWQWRRLAREWEWRRLAQVCRKWRYVISLSPRRLDLRILCEYGSPIENVLYSWPTLPVVIRHNAVGSVWTYLLMPRNIMVALRHPDRLCEVNLSGVPSSWTGPIVEMLLKPCQALERIRITVKNATEPSILIQDAFLGGTAPHLREIELDGISFPFVEIRRVLSSTDNLNELHLFKIPHAAYFSPDELYDTSTPSIHYSPLSRVFLFSWHKRISGGLRVTNRLASSPRYYSKAL